MGISCHHVAGHATFHHVGGSSSSRSQKFFVDNSSKSSWRSNNTGIVLKGQNLRFSCGWARQRSGSYKRSFENGLRLRCCDASAAVEAEILAPDDSVASSSTQPLLRVHDFEVKPILQEAENVVFEAVAHPELSRVSPEVSISTKPHESIPPLVEEPDEQDETSSLLHGDEDKGLWQQMLDIVNFAGPALGIWLSGPMMSLIDTAVVGNCSSLELAALGPGTVFCDQLCYVFMFLSVATSNLIATSLAKQDEARAAQHLKRLLFVALACGVGMFVLTGAYAEGFLKRFVGPNNAGLVSAAFSYVQIRGFAWPAVLVGMVAQSASLGMQDSWSPLKVLAVASFVNLFGDILLCTFLGQGIAGAAWATMVSQYIAGFLMLRSLKKKGFSLALMVPSAKELMHMIEIAAPVLLTMLSKVSFYAFITYLSTSLGAVTLGAHQVMIGIYSTCTVSGEPLCQTAQSFMPALIQGKNPNHRKAKMLLRSLLLIGAIMGVSLGCFALGFPWVFPQVFTNDAAIISQMKSVTVPFFCALVTTPPLLSLEGTLLAGRDLKFLSLSMVSCFIFGSAMLLAFKKLGFGLQGFWWTLTCFQSARFLSSFWRLKSAKSVLREPVGA